MRVRFNCSIVRGDEEEAAVPPETFGDPMDRFGNIEAKGLADVWGS
jgi:hypothetical protein